MSAPRLGCVVMASGEGRRFGGDKLLHPLLGKPLMSYVLAALPPEPRTVVVARDARVAALARAMGREALLHALPDQSDTIRLGLEALRETDGCLFAVADQPLLTGASVRRLLDAFAPDVVCRLCAGGREGNPVLFPRAAYPALLRLRPGQTGGAVLRQGRWPVVPIEADDPAELFDIDTPEDLRAAETLLRARKEGLL